MHFYLFWCIFSDIDVYKFEFPLRRSLRGQEILKQVYFEWKKNVSLLCKLSHFEQIFTIQSLRIYEGDLLTGAFLYTARAQEPGASASSYDLHGSGALSSS